jgi:hypothetical protein
MENRAPWELMPIDLYRTTGEDTGRLPFGNFHYYREDDFLVLNGGSTWHIVYLADI